MAYLKKENLQLGGSEVVELAEMDIKSEIILLIDEWIDGLRLTLSLRLSQIYLSQHLIHTCVEALFFASYENLF
jgi:hypothetical protein